MPVQNGIFYERQRGGQCRLHSLNAFFGDAKLSDSEFAKYKKEFDQFVKQKFNVNVSCSSYDIFNADQNTIVSYILGRFGYYTRLIPFNSHFGKPIDISDLKGNFFFVFNQGHIWGMRKKDNTNRWYKVDSMGGVRQIPIRSLQNTKNIGMIIPVNMTNEFYRNIDLIKQEIFPEYKKNKTNPSNDKLLERIILFLSKLNKSKLILGNIEIPLTIAMDILEIRYNNIKLSKEQEIKQFEPIRQILEKFNEFYSQFSEGNYNDIDLILKYLPEIILTLIKLDHRRIGVKIK